MLLTHFFTYLLICCWGMLKYGMVIHTTSISKINILNWNKIRESEISFMGLHFKSLKYRNISQIELLIFNSLYHFNAKWLILINQSVSAGGEILYRWKAILPGMQSGSDTLNTKKIFPKMGFLCYLPAHGVCWRISQPLVFPTLRSRTMSCGSTCRTLQRS